MEGNATLQLLADEMAIRHLPALYARAIDRNEPELFDRIFAADGVIVGPSGEMHGIDAIRGMGDRVRARFAATWHAVLNQTLWIEGDVAHGETYCLAHHFTHALGGGAAAFNWAIRYQDRFARGGDGQWVFTRRELWVDWTQAQAAELGFRAL
jgi:hypothetical protein